MRIRTKLTLQFAGIVKLLLVIFSFSIYFTAEHFRHKNFTRRLKEKALNTANLLIEVDEINTSLLKTLRRKYLVSLPGEFVRVYDENNNLLFRDDTVSFKLNESHLRKFHEDGIIEMNVGERQVVAIRFKDKYRITSSAIDIEGKRQMNDLRLILLIANFFSILIVFFSGLFFAIQAIKPISRINRQAQEINENNLDLRLKVNSNKDEIGQLAGTFNMVFDRLQMAFERQKRFVSDVSHEIRTPLTAITGEIEVSLMKERSSEAYVEVLKSVLEEAKTLTTLSNVLLKIAQAAEGSGNFDRVPLDLTIKKLHHDLEKRFLKFDLVQWEPLKQLKSNAFIHCHQQLLNIAVANLVENALKFSDSKPVKIKFTVIHESLTITVIDEGIGINESDLNMIGQAFYRVSSESDGHGIGLSLTKKIILLHKGEIRIDSKPGHGTIVTVILPLV